MKLVKIAAVGVLSTAAVLSFASGAYAAPSSLAQTTSKGYVTFKEDTSVTPPLDPSSPDPKNPVVPDPGAKHPVEPGTGGSLSIDRASNIEFGDQDISAADQDYYAKLDKLLLQDGTTKQVPNYVQVTDKRGTSAGWTLQVTQQGQFKSAVNGNILVGAQLSFANINTNGTSLAAPPTPATDFEIEVAHIGQANTVLTAAAGKGMGTWFANFGTSANGEKSIKLHVPGTSIKAANEEYSTTLTWNLLDGPL
ncbi:cell surface protein with WxL domain [Listeria floridensis FSL S10-1187]|uniref:Cell surface protein with WxL domain n=1 Tax=Listeria floridensis FSL S10-1187 TaxID=1265817 RepID=A0ABP3B3C7_9LIST|nr:WxL domain-containing protein [Listeria floridensis]EUJ33690.1 cell surface protein with WxL domain [Listeria floridensis FSL S10-1187]